MTRWLAALALLAAAMPAGAARRIVSTNPCVDAILMAVADQRSIAAISNYSRDPRASSITPAQARRFPGTSGSAEELAALKPDLVLADTLMPPMTVAALRRLGIALVQFPQPSDIAESRAQVSRIAALVGHPERGHALNRRIDDAVRRGHVSGRAPVAALVWQGSGLVLGEATLANALIRNAGMTNHSRAYGFGQWGMVSMEQLVAQPPALILLGGADADAGANGARMLVHPALRSLVRRIAVRPFPSRLFRCGGPTIIEAAPRLAQIRRSLPL